MSRRTQGGRGFRALGPIIGGLRYPRAPPVPSERSPAAGRGRTVTRTRIAVRRPHARHTHHRSGAFPAMKSNQEARPGGRAPGHGRTPRETSWSRRASRSGSDGSGARCNQHRRHAWCVHGAERPGGSKDPEGTSGGGPGYTVRLATGKRAWRGARASPQSVPPRGHAACRGRRALVVLAAMGDAVRMNRGCRGRPSSERLLSDVATHLVVAPAGPRLGAQR